METSQETEQVVRTTPIKLDDGEHAFVTQVGPWPFTRNMQTVEWTGKTNQEVIDHYSAQMNPKAKSIVAKLKRASS